MSEACSAPRHTPTRHSYERLGCRCPRTVEAVRAIWAQRAHRLPKGQPRSAPRPRDPYIDWANVVRAVGGDRVTLTIAERGAAIDRLTDAGLSALRIAERLRVAPRTVFRYRAGEIAHARSEAA